jgi:hypothetical protein
LFLLPGLIWFTTKKWWDRKAPVAVSEAAPSEAEDETDQLATNELL